MKNISLWYSRGTFCLTRNSENFETGTNCIEISWESFQKIWKWMNFQKANHLIENSRKSGGKSIGKVIFDKKFPKISVHLTRLSSFLEILKLLSEPFVTRNLWKFKPDFSSNGKCPRLPVWPSLDQSPLHVKTKLIGFNSFHLILHL